MGKGLLLAASSLLLASALCGQTVTYAPYLQPGDNGPFGPTDQIVVAWQTDETTPKPDSYKVEYGVSPSLGLSATPAGRVVDNYLSADPSLPVIPGVYGAHVDYYTVLSGLAYDTTYHYKVVGPGMPGNGFTASFHTRTKSGQFSFAVEGDEGFFPGIPNTTQIVDFEARIAHLIYDANKINVPGASNLPAVQFVLDTGDNIYTYGDEANYRDFFFPVQNADIDSNETGAPILRNMLFYVVDGNHDLGSTGVSANLLASNSAPQFSGNEQGGDALAFFNNLYFPLNGPTGVDINYTWDTTSAVANGMTFSYMGNTYTSPAAIAAYRASTTVNTGKGTTRQIDHQSNYSFDTGNTHFVFLDANPHLFDGILPSGSPAITPEPAYPAYPNPLREWLIHDLDSSNQTWKVVVYHQPAFTSGDATLLNNQMRAIAKFLEDHGVNVVFNGHDHNYQRSLPLRATARTAGPVVTTGSPALYIDPTFDGHTQTVPDGVLYIIEGAGGNRDFDNNLPAPRGSGLGVDQDDAATGTYTPTPGLTVEQGPADWLDTNLSNLDMANLVPNAGKGPKITRKLKSKVFSFGHVVVDNNKFTLYQISEPLKSTSSATSGDPAPYGTDLNGKPLNDPIDNTVLDSTTGSLISAPEDGPSALLDEWTITKPDITNHATIQLSAPPSADANGALVYTVRVSNKSAYSLNGAQIHLGLTGYNTLGTPETESLTLDGPEAVYTFGRLEAGSTERVQIKTRVNANAPAGSFISTSARLTSATALPIGSNGVITQVVHAAPLPALP